MGNFWAIIKSINAVAGAIKSVADIYNKWQLKKIEKHYTQKVNAKKLLAKAIEGANDDETRRELVRRLGNLTNS